MEWKKYTITTTTEAEDIISSMLMDVGVGGVEIEDKVPLTQVDREEMFIDIMPITEVDDGVAYISFYLKEEEDAAPLLSVIKEELKNIGKYTNIGTCTITKSLTEDKDWINNWKEYFHQFYVEDILIAPTWEEVKIEDSQKVIIRIDPGTAFGTGMHETTNLCIRQLKSILSRGDKVLDIGCGSGILGMIALKLGASYVFGTDLDLAAIEATHENMKENELQREQYKVVLGDIISDKKVQNQVGYEVYDVVVANILAEALVAITPAAIKALKPGGFYITSGILREKEEMIVDRMKHNGLEVVNVSRQGEWISVMAKK